MSVIIPQAKDLTTLILSALPSTLTPTELAIVSNTIENLVNDGVTPNELYNAVINGLPPFQQFLNEIAITKTLTQTFKGYSEIWVPFQFGIIIGIYIIVMAVLIIAGYIPIDVGIILIIAGAAFVAVFGILEFDALSDYLNNAETDFITKFNNAFNKFKTNILLSSALGYVAGSQLTVNGPTGPNGLPGFGPIILNDPTVTFPLKPPYYKVSILQTETPMSATPPAIFPVLLLENTVQLQVPANTIKPQYGKIIYLANGNHKHQSGAAADTGIIKITNASKFFPETFNIGTGVFEIPASTLIPPFPGSTGGIFIRPGECTCLVNVGFNQETGSLGLTGAFACSTWVELSSIARPNSSVFTSTDATSFPRPISTVTFLNIPNTATVDLTTNVTTEYSLPQSEWYLYSNPGSDGTSTTSINPGTFAYQYNSANAYINVTLHSGTFKLLKGQFCCLVFSETTLRWEILYTPGAV